jgi:ribosomal protein L11 methyltransferase
VVIEIDPGMAFGTGQHPSTRMCLEAVEDILLKDRTIKNWIVLDVGTGTGILGITSVKLGARRAVCVDIDRKATDIAHENVKINHVENQVEIINGDVRTIREPFDLIIANLTAKILIKLCIHLISLMGMGGYLVLAGIIEQDRNDIEEYFCTDLFPYKIITEKEWICYVLGRRGK